MEIDGVREILKKWVNGENVDDFVAVMRFAHRIENSLNVACIELAEKSSCDKCNHYEKCTAFANGYWTLDECANTYRRAICGE